MSFNKFQQVSSQNFSSKNFGFTLIEILISLAVMTILATVVGVSFVNFRARQALSLSADEIVSTIRRAQTAAKNQENNSAWGVYFNNPGNGPETYTLFYGNSHATGTVVLTRRLGGGLDFSDPPSGASKEIVFEQATGMPFSTSSIVIVLKNNDQVGRTISVNSSGAVTTDTTVGPPPPPAPDIAVSSGGSQVASTSPNTADLYIGGYFTLVRDSGNATVTQMIISDVGTISAQNHLSNLRLYYETTASCNYDGSEALFGSAASFNSSDQATVSGSMNVGTAQVCVYAVLDVGSGASNGETINITIENPSVHITVSEGTVSPASQVAISGTTEVQTSGQIALDGSAGGSNAEGGGNCSGTSAWDPDAICVRVPSGTGSGSRPSTVTSDTLESNSQAFTVD